MKRFLFPVLALAITACGNNDIVVTSEVGEKLIVERDTIKLKSTSKDDDKSFDEIIDLIKQTSDYFCDYGTPAKCNKKRDEIKAYEHALELNKGPVWSKQFRYLPVLKDRNGTETVGKERFITCIKPDLDQESREILSKDSFLSTLISMNNGNTLYDSVARTICKEYAKWEVQ